MFGFILQTLAGLFDPIGWAVTALVLIVFQRVPRGMRVVVATILVPFVMAGIGYLLNGRLAMFPAWFCTVGIEAIVGTLIQARFMRGREPPPELPGNGGNWS